MKSITFQYFHPVSDSTENLSSHISTASPQNISTHLTKLASVGPSRMLNTFWPLHTYHSHYLGYLLSTWHFPLCYLYSTLFMIFFVPHYHDGQSLCLRNTTIAARKQLLLLLWNSALNRPFIFYSGNQVGIWMRM